MELTLETKILQSKYFIIITYQLITKCSFSQTVLYLNKDFLSVNLNDLQDRL